MQITGRVSVNSSALKGQAPHIIQERCKAALHEACAFGKRQVMLRTPQGVSGAQGGLLGSIQFEVRPTKYGVTGVIGTANPYGLVVEMGRRPGMGMPPKGTLLRWIEVKMGKSPEEAEAIEFPLRRSIGRKGTKGVEMFAKLLTDDRAALETIFDRHGFKLTAELAAP